MVRKFCASFLAAVLAVMPSFAADLVSDYTVNGTTYTRSGFWLVSDGATIVFKYKNLPQSGTERLVSWSQSDQQSYTGLVGLCSYGGVLKGWWRDGYWAGGSINTKTLGTEGLIVCVYGPNSDGVTAYNAEGSVIFRADGLRSTGVGVTMGARFDFSPYVSDVKIYNSAITADEVSTIVNGPTLEPDMWLEGSAIQGWTNTTSGDSGEKTERMIGPNRDVPITYSTYAVSWLPYTDVAAKDAFTVASYINTELMSSSKLAVIWSFGTLAGNSVVLCRTSIGNIRLLTIDKVGIRSVVEVTADKITPGYHLYTASFTAGGNIALMMDGKDATYVTADANLSEVSDGFQIGTIKNNSSSSNFAQGLNLGVADMVGFNRALTKDEMKSLVSDYPATTSYANPIMNNEAMVFYAPSLKNTSTLSVPKGRIVLGVSETVTTGISGSAVIQVNKGVTFDVAKMTTVGTSYQLDVGGTITNSGAAIGTNLMQVASLSLYKGNATVTGNTFGLVAPRWGASTLNFRTYTLNVNMNAGEKFILCNTTFQSGGKLRLESGRLYFVKKLSGTLNLDLPQIPSQGDRLFELDEECDLSALTLNVTVNGEPLPETHTVNGEGVIEVAEEGVISATGALPETTAFSWVPGSAPSGWFTSWGGEAGGNPAVQMIGPSGTVDEVHRVYNDGGNNKWHPWKAMDAKNKYSLSLYGCVDLIKTPAEGKYAVLWAMGGSPRTVLAMDSNRNIVLLNATGGGDKSDATISQSIVAQTIKGYHLITVTFDSEKGASLTIDAENTVENAEFKAVPGNGIQFGSIYGGLQQNFEVGRGLVILGMCGYGEPISREAIATLAELYPAVETITETITINQVGNSIYLPSITIPDGKHLRVQKGTLVVPASVEATLAALEFGDTNSAPLGFGMELDGTITIVNNKTFTSNDEKTAYDACNAGRGVNFGEWAGVGEFNIRGTFNAPDTVVVVVHDSSKVTINVDDGTVNVKGITAKEPERATINLANGATWTYSEKVSECDSVTLSEEGEYSIVSDNGAYKLTRAAEEDYVFTETQTVSQTLSGAVSVTVNPGEGGVVMFSAANTFTGGLIVESGTAKTTSATGFGPNNYNLWANPDALGQIEVKDGATLDLANTKDTCYSITTAGTITNSGSDIGTTNRQTVKIALSGDATVSGNTFGLLAPNNNATTLDFGEQTLTVAMNEGKSFILSNTTISGEGTIKLKSGSLWINKDKSLNGTIKLDLSEFSKEGGTVATGSAAQLEKIVLAEGQTGWTLEVDGTTLKAVYSNPIIKVGEAVYDTLEDALAHLTDGALVTILNLEEVSVQDFADHAVSLVDNGDGSYTAALDKADGIALRFSEIMPKPSDKPYSITTQAGYDKNGLESGWVELENTSDKWVDLKDYKFCRANRGKAYTHADYGNFLSVMIPPHGRFTFYTSERYSNSYPEAKDGNTSAFQHGTFDGKPIWYGDMLIWGDKVNPKKFPYVTLVYRPETAAADTILETVIIPSDTPEGYSIIVGHDEGEGEATKRWLCPTPTFNKANSDTPELVKIGPNVGSVYGTAKSVSEFAATAPAKIGEAYPVSLNVNPVYNAAGPREADKITAVTLVYRTKLGKGVSGEVPMTKSGTNDGGDVWTAEIPAADIPSEPGQLIQWKTKITDAASNIWTSPSFMNKDDGYEWFGTITEPDELNSANLPTWHMFADEASVKQMDKDTDDQDTSVVPHNARVAIYDMSTSTYHDYVRIDLRGNTSSHFTKKSHGLRFSKVNPLTMKDAVQGGEVKEIRKSSLIGEPADPSFMRQMIAFWLWNKMGNKVPFDFPVRCNLNGEFYQLAFHSERFTDELIEDVYGLDKYGYGYKNVGRLDSKLSTSAGGIEKKTPDDGQEGDTSVLKNELATPMYQKGVENGVENNSVLTKFVVEKFDLPAWFNYLASARITQEMDDVWANISAYYDLAEMKEGERGTGTWMPLGYDFNLTFGQWYYNDVGSGSGLMADQDWFKSHPFYGGLRVRCYKKSDFTTPQDGWNRGIEAVLQNAKFRRLYLRRLRTLMDQELKAPGTPETDVPFMVKMRQLATLMEADAVLDQKKWPHSSSNTGAIDVWRNGVSWPATMSAGIDDIWNNYVVPRQKHLYVTHAASSIGETDSEGKLLTKLTEIGYGSSLSAGIPAAQSSLEELKAGLSAEAVEGGIVIRNTNAETIDLSGWDVAGPIVMKLPAGTVIDEGSEENPGEVFVVTDRVAYIEANELTLTDEVIIGNAKVGSGTDIGLTAADGTIVLSADVILPPGTYTDKSYDVPVRLAPAGSFAFEGVAFNGGLTLGDGSFTLKNQNGYTNTASVVTAPTANISFTGKGAFELKGEKTSGTLMTVNDLIVSNGVFTVESKAATEGTSAVYLNGGFAVEDKGAVNLKLTKNAASGRGFYIANKKMFCRIGKGGKFNAELNGPSCQAIHVEKGSVDLEVKNGATITATGTGANARYFKIAGNIVISGGTITAEASGKGAEIFSSDKDITISGGTLNLKSSDDCVNATTGITISGGTINATSTSGDVFDSNGKMTITGGSIVGLAIGSETDGNSGQVFDVNEPNVIDFTDSTANIFAISGIDATLGEEAAAADISGKTIKEWTAPEITGVETVKLFMMVDGQVITLDAEGPATWDEIEVTETTTIEELVGAEQAETLAKFEEVTPEIIANWAKTHSSSTKPGEAIDLVAFALNCAPNEEAIDAAKKNFKVTITMTEEGPVAEIESGYYNVTPVLKGKVELPEENWIEVTEGNKDALRFFRAFIEIGD